MPGISHSEVLTFEEAGAQGLRVNILPKKFFRDPDKPWHTSVDSGKTITVVR